MSASFDATMREVSVAPPVHVPLSNGRGYLVHFAPLAALPALMEDSRLRCGRCLVITDTQVERLYRCSAESTLADAGWTPRFVSLTPGEQVKHLEALAQIYDAALHWKIERTTPVIALGGGVVGDLAGFAAATLLRGLPLVHVPTSLIAQVDSAIGGKTGINHACGKNLIGAFYHPVFTLADIGTLSTLSEVQWASGLAEVVKHALLDRGRLFSDLESDWSAILQRKTAVVAAIVPRAAAIKAAIVAVDERETHRRAVLNFGHTFGHAIERVAGYGRFTHGEAVALGMRAALHLSGILHQACPTDRAIALVNRIPIRRGLSGFSISSMMEAMYFDKKVLDRKLRLILLRSIGDPYVFEEASSAQIRRAWESICC